MYTDKDMDEAFALIMDMGPKSNPEGRDKEKIKAFDNYLNIDTAEAMIWYILQGGGSIYDAGHFATGLALGLALARKREDDNSGN